MKTEAMAMDLQSEIQRLEQRREDARRFVAETRSAPPAIWPVVVTAMIIGAALFGGGMAVAKMIGA